MMMKEETIREELLRRKDLRNRDHLMNEINENFHILSVFM
jgi:hypothetical protein